MALTRLSPPELSGWSGSPARVNAASDSTISVYVYGQLVFVNSWTKMGASVSAYSSAVLWSGLPRCHLSMSPMSAVLFDGDRTDFAFTMDGNTGDLRVATRGTALASGDVVWGSLIYVAADSLT